MLNGRFHCWSIIRNKRTYPTHQGSHRKWRVLSHMWKSWRSVITRRCSSAQFSHTLCRGYCIHLILNDWSFWLDVGWYLHNFSGFFRNSTKFHIDGQYKMQRIWVSDTLMKNPVTISPLKHQWKSTKCYAYITTSLILTPVREDCLKSRWGTW